jgi:AGCS family alanine or glycine:cation symporter
MLADIVREAFSPTQAAGAFMGATAWFGLTTGLRRALFSNEAGQGSSPIAHSAAKTDEPVREGVVAGLEPFIDTCLVCTLTALVILSTNTWKRSAVGEFKDDISIVQTTNETGEQTAQVFAPTSVDALPALAPPAKWFDANRFFLLAEVPTANANTGSNRVRIGGTLDASGPDADGDGAPDLVIVWDAPPRDARLIDKGVYQDLVGAPLTGHAFDRAIPGLGKWLVTFTCWLFAFSTMISWSYYGEQGIVFLFGRRLEAIAVLLYKLTFCALAILASWPGFIETDAELGLLADLGTGVMLMANVPIIVLMAPLAMRAFKDYFGRLSRGEMEPPHQPPGLSDMMEGRDVK